MTKNTTAQFNDGKYLLRVCDSDEFTAPLIPDIPVFMQPRFFQLHASNASVGLNYSVYEAEREVLVATCNFGKQESGSFRSPVRGSFGGLAATSPLTVREQETIFSAILEDLAHRGAQAIAITLPPLAYYSAETSVGLNVLLRMGFSIFGHELAFVRAVSPEESFRSRIDSGNKNKINKCLKAGFVTRKLVGLDELRAAHEVIRLNRAKKDIPLTMEWDGLRQMAEHLPESICAFGCFRGAEMVASSVCVRVDARVLYIFYWGELPGFEPWSPVSLLAQTIYEFAVAEGIRLIDAGVSTLNGVPNYGLLSYKKSLGFIETLKFSVRRIIAWNIEK